MASSGRSIAIANSVSDIFEPQHPSSKWRKSRMVDSPARPSVSVVINDARPSMPRCRDATSATTRNFLGRSKCFRAVTASASRAWNRIFETLRPTIAPTVRSCAPLVRPSASSTDRRSGQPTWPLCLLISTCSTYSTLTTPGWDR